MPRFFTAFGLFISLLAVGRAQTVALTVNPNSREEVRQFYRAIYNASEGVPMGWTGNYASGNAGDTSAAFKEATRLRVNFFRALVGVPAAITFNSTYSAADQQAAFMQSVNARSNNVIELRHFPPATWRFYTAAGANASANSNLYFGKAGADSVTGYVADAGPTNFDIGHRRWLFLPQTLQMGTGDVPGDGTIDHSAANALWILDTTPGGTSSSPRPATRTQQIAYPPAGYVPFQLVWPRWSFSYAGADFSTATVTMTRAGQSIPVRLEELDNASVIGENSIVWVYNDTNPDFKTNSNLETPHSRPTADTPYTVNVNNVRIGGASQNFSYTVTVFDPDVTAADSLLSTVTGTSTPPTDQATPYAVAKQSFANAFDWRTLQVSPFTKTYTAESGLDGLVANTTSGYSVVQTIISANDKTSYRLAHAQPISDQSLSVPETFLVGGSNSAFTFQSRLGIATGIQVARVQVSTDDRASWVDVYTQPGTSASGINTPASTEADFVRRTISLAAYVGRTINVRFAFTADLGSAYVPGENNVVGWFIDDVALTNVQSVSAGTPQRVLSGNTLSFTPAAAGVVTLQSRGVLFGSYPVEWGPALALTAIDTRVNNNPGRLVNLSILTSLSATDTSFTMGYVVGGAGTSGNKPILIRAAGPSLAQLGVSGALADPKLELFAGAARSGENDNWGGGTELSTAMASVGAFAYINAASRDSAIVANITTSNNSAVVSSANSGTGTVIAELYDSTAAATFTATTPRLINVSVLKHLGTGLTAGFVVGGSTAKTVLVRAIGPTIGAAPFNVGGAVADPQVTLFGAGAVKLGENDNWGGTTALTAAFSQVGAFALPAGSRDAALVVTLQPGNYTVQVNGVGNTTGVALVEVYEVP